MSDGGAENLRKQIAFLSNLIDSHKSTKQNENAIEKTIPNPKRNKTWSRWKSDSALNKSKSSSAQDNELNENIQDSKSFNVGLSQTSDILSTGTHQNSSDIITSESKLNAKTKPNLVLRSDNKSLQKSSSRITPPSHALQSTQQQKSNLSTKYTFHKRATHTKSAPPTNYAHGSTSETTSRRVLAKTPLSKSCSSIETPVSGRTTCNSRKHLINQQPSTSRQPMGSFKWTKNEKVHPRLQYSKSTGENEASSSRIVVKSLPKTSSLSALSRSKSLRKTTSLPNVSLSRHLPHNNSNATTVLDIRKLPSVKSHSFKRPAESASISKGAKLKWRRKSVGQLNDSNKPPKSKTLYGDDLQTRLALKAKYQSGGRAKRSSTMLRKTTRNIYSKTSGNRIHSYTKNIIFKSQQTVPRRSKLKWSKSLSGTNLRSKSEELPVRKTRFAHNSRFSLKRRKSEEGKLSGGHLHVRRIQQRSRAISRFKLQNKGFVARRLKYIALGSQTPTKSFVSKYRRQASAQPRRKITIGGSHYIISSHGKTLQKTTLSKEPGRAYWRSNTASTTTRTVCRIFKRQNSVDKNKTRTANKILKRTLHNVQAVMKRVKKPKSEEYCMFYNKFGKCTKHKQGTCPYIHDPTKIAVCTRFLRGKCQQMNGTCPFSHKIDKEKMPICEYFLKGKCNRDDCPYSHVNVGQEAAVCEDFLKGYCALGFKCKRKHVVECEEFSKTGQCRNRAKCKLIHRKKIHERKRYFDEGTSSSTLDEEDYGRGLKKARGKSSDGFLPLEGPILSEEERVDPIGSISEDMAPSVSLRIRPNFTTKNTQEEE